MTCKISLHIFCIIFPSLLFTYWFYLWYVLPFKCLLLIIKELNLPNSSFMYSMVLGPLRWVVNFSSQAHWLEQGASLNSPFRAFLVSSGSHYLLHSEFTPVLTAGTHKAQWRTCIWPLPVATGKPLIMQEEEAKFSRSSLQNHVFFFI